MRCHYVEAVRGDARAEEPSVDPCPACLGMLLGLDDHERAAFAEHEAGAVLVEWPRCPRGVVVIGGHHDAHIGERGDGRGLDGCLDTTADGDIGVAVSDLPPGVGYALVTGGTRRDGGDDATARLAFQADDGGRSVGHEHLNGERGNGLCAPGAHLVVRLDQLLATAQSGAHRNRQALQIDVFRGSGVFPNLTPQDRSQTLHIGQAAKLDLRHVFVEVADLEVPADLHR
ncbi:Uncharacterised protein [Mycobacteroides abscessus subsp. abscessus]|nr:Uncharacterised protein [Mycobacteroides abscessus subsp. abscessus]